MKITITPISQAELDDVHEQSDAGEIHELPPEEAREVFLRCKHIEISDQAARFIQREMGLTPDEFVAELLKQAGALQ